MKKIANKIANNAITSQLINDAYLGMQFSRITPQLIISRDSEGNALSLFSHDTWSFPLLAFAVTDSAFFSFDSWRNGARHNSENIDLCKKIIVMLLFFPFSKSKKPTRLSTMHDYVGVLRTICAYSDRLNTTILGLLTNITFFSNLLETCPPTVIKRLKTMITNLNQINVAELGFSISGQTVSLIKTKAKEKRRDSQQHPVIPSRILWLKNQQQQSVLGDFTENKDNLLSLINKACTNLFYARTLSYSQNYRNKRKHISDDIRKTQQAAKATFKAALKEHGLENLAARYKWRNIFSICNFLTLVQFCARCQIHLLSLMRDGEALSLERDCLTPAVGWNSEALYLIGESTKLDSVRTIKKWVTIPNIEVPINILRTINSVISPYVNETKLKNRLFVSASYLPISNVEPSSEGKIPRAWLDKQLPEVLITEEDLAELELIEPWRNWRTDPKYKIGTPWSLTSHQYRRSIAVFAGQSGLMTLPSLKRLLHHWTKIMGIYYTRGCSVNNYLMKTLNPELSLELSAAKRYADAALYIRDVVNSHEDLLGIQGKRLMDHKSNVWIYQSPEETAKDILNGVRSWSPSPVGGCTLNGHCDRRAHGNFIYCAYCPNCIAKLSAINETITEIEFEISDLEPGTIEHRAELQNLKDWEDVRAIIIAKS